MKRTITILIVGGAVLGLILLAGKSGYQKTLDDDYMCPEDYESAEAYAMAVARSMVEFEKNNPFAVDGDFGRVRQEEFDSHNCTGHHFLENPPEEAAPTAPKFEDFPVSEIYRGTPASPDLGSNPLGQTHPTRIIEGAKEGPTFSGHFTIVSWGCGTSCQHFAVVDAVSGRIFDGLTTALGQEFHIDSSLLVVDPFTQEDRENPSGRPAWLTARFYEWTGSEFVLLGSEELVTGAEGSDNEEPRQPEDTETCTVVGDQIFCGGLKGE